MGVFHVDEQVRFRVEGVTYTKVETTASGVRRTKTTSTAVSQSTGFGDGSQPPPSAGAGVRERSLSITEELPPEAPSPPAMAITASVKDPGLGLVAWSFE